MRNVHRLFCLFFLSSFIFVIGCSEPQSMFAPVPDTAPLLFQVTELEKSWTSLESTEFYSSLTNLIIWDDPAVSSAIEELKAGLKNAEKDIGVPINKETIMSVLGQKVDFAIVPLNEMPGLLLITDLKKNSSAIKFLDYLQKQMNPSEVKNEEYQKIEINLIQVSPDFTLVYFFNQDKLVLTNQKKLTYQCIDLLKGKGKTLFESKKFAEMTKDYGSYSHLFYADAKKAIELIKNVTGDTQNIKFQNIEYDYILAGWGWSETGVEGQAKTYFSDSAIAEMFSSKNSVMDIGKWIPQNSMAAYAINFDLEKVIAYQRKQLSALEDQTGQDYWENLTVLLSENLGLDYESDLEKLLGYGAFVAVQGINSQGFVPIPDLVLGIGIDDREDAENVMHRIEGEITAKYSEKHLQFQSVDVGSFQFRYIPLPFGANLAPGYLVTDKFILLATSTNTIQTAFDTSQNPKNTILNCEAITRHQKKTDNVIAFQYLDSHQLWTSLDQLVNNYRMFFPEKINPDHVQEAMKTFSLIDNYYAFGEIEDNSVSGKFYIQVK